jgi:hypothetical protein
LESSKRGKGEDGRLGGFAKTNLSSVSGALSHFSMRGSNLF